MATTLPIQLFSNGAVARDVINAIATFFHSDSFTELLWMSIVIGLVCTWARYLCTRDHQGLLKWLLVYIAVPLFLINTTRNVQILDASEPGVAYSVDNVPVGVAAPAYLGTSYMMGMARAIETIFHTPDDQAYSRTGLLFGSRLYRLSNRIGIQDAELKDWWSQYLRNCIRKDITINSKYTWNDFATAPDIFTFLANNHPSPVRRIAMSWDNYVTCQDALPIIQQRFDDEVKKSLSLLASRIYGSKAAQQQAFLEQALQHSDQYFHHISRSAATIMRQNMAINAVRDGLFDSAARANASAAAINYSYTQTQMQSTALWASIGMQAQEFLPLLQTVLFLLILCSSILVLLLAMIPALSATVLINYIKGILYLATWPVLFAFLNFIMTSALAHSTNSVTSLYGGINLSNQNALEAMHIRFAAITGWLMMLVPLITPFIVRGGASIMGNIAYQFAGMVNSVAGRTSAAVASGDIALGNTQLGNHTWNQQSANKTDTRYSDQSYGYTMQRDDGVTVTDYGSHKVYNTAGQISATALNLNNSETQSRLLQQSVNEAQRVSEQSRLAANRSIDQTSEQLLGWSQSTAASQQYGQGTHSGYTNAVSEAASTINSVVSEYAKSQGITEAQASSKLFSGYFGGEANIEASSPKFWKFLTAGLRGSTGFKKSWDDSESTTTQSSDSQRAAASLQEQFNTAMSTVAQHGLHTTTQDSNSRTDQALNALNDSLRDTQSQVTTAAKDFQKEQSLTSAWQAAQTNSLTASSNLMAEFQSYLQEVRPYHVETLMVGKTPDIRWEREAYAKQFLEQRFSTYNPILAKDLTHQSPEYYQSNPPAPSSITSGDQPSYAMYANTQDPQQLEEARQAWLDQQKKTAASQPQYFDNGAHGSTKQNTYKHMDQVRRDVKQSKQ
jgi:conjugal transfer mating pair stabilization protein TraG